MSKRVYTSQMPDVNDKLTLELVGAWVKHKRTSKHMSITDAATKCGIGHPAYRTIEQGNGNVIAEKLFQVLQGMHINLRIHVNETQHDFLPKHNSDSMLALIGRWVKHTREYHHYTHAELMAKYDFSRKTLVNIEQGNGKIIAQNLFKVLDALGIDLYVKKHQVEEKSQSNMIYDLDLSYIGNYIRQARMNSNMRIVDVARDCGISHVTLRNIEYGNGHVMVKNFFKVLDYLELTLSMHSPSMGNGPTPNFQDKLSAELISEQLKDARVTLKITPLKAASKCGISHMTYRKIEQNAGRVMVVTLLKVFEGFNITLGSRLL